MKGRANLELSKLIENAKAVFEISDISELGAAISEKMNDASIFQKWADLVPDMTTDNLQPIFQYYMADRKEKMQDYTPKSLAKALCMVAGVQNGGTVYDMCAGSGALTIQAWNINPELRFICMEYDERVIPLLLFNLAVRNMDAIVIHGNVLSEENFEAYRVVKGVFYSSIIQTAVPEEIKADICISTPPYNLKFKLPEYANRLSCYKYGLPHENNANYAFVEKAITAADRAALLLPCGVMTADTKKEKAIIKSLCDHNLIDSITINPDSMFESTSIGTCIFSLCRKKETTTVEMVDMRQVYTEEVRLQNGQFGGSSHENRTYKKTVKTYSDDNIKLLLSAISERTNKVEFSAAVPMKEIAESDYKLSPSRYIAFEFKESFEHRPFPEIVRDINKITALKNNCKLVINETLARRMKLSVEEFKEDIKGFPEEQKNFFESVSGTKLTAADYVQFTKNKGEFVLKSNNPECISEIMEFALAMWKERIRFLNNQENIYLAEFRDALVPELMSGRMDPFTGEIREEDKGEEKSIFEKSFEEFLDGMMI